MTDDIQPLLPGARHDDYTMYERNRIDYKLAELLNGDHPIEGNHEVKVIQLEELIILYNATQAAGWARHTGDWDWFVTITHEGKEYPSPQPGPNDPHNDDGFAFGMSFNFADRPDDFTACVDHEKVTHIELEYDAGTDEHTVQLDINHITNVNWEQA